MERVDLSALYSRGSQTSALGVNALNLPLLHSPVDSGVHLFHKGNETDPLPSCQKIMPCFREPAFRSKGFARSSPRARGN